MIVKIATWGIAALALWCFATSFLGFYLQSKEYQREQERAKNVRPAIGPIVQPAPHHTSQLATVSTGCLSDVENWE